MIRFYTFMENEMREFSPARSMCDAVRKVRNGSADGLCIRLDGDFTIAYEVMPGRPIVTWWGDECF